MMESLGPREGKKERAREEQSGEEKSWTGEKGRMEEQRRPMASPWRPEG